jgi:hypothetical protein
MSGVEAVILAIDPAKHTSGAALLLPDYGNPRVEEPHPFDGNYVVEEFGKVTSQEERGRYIEALMEAMMETGLPLVIVAEEWDPPRGKTDKEKWTFDTILGIGEGWGRWTAEIETASMFLKDEENLPAIPVVRVKPNEWRDGVFPPPRPKDTRALKETAKRVFEGVFGFKASDDISEAGCIGLWATTSPEVAAAVAAWEAESKPKPRNRAERRRQKHETG